MNFVFESPKLDSSNKYIQDNLGFFNFEGEGCNSNTTKCLSNQKN